MRDAFTPVLCGHHADTTMPEKLTDKTVRDARVVRRDVEKKDGTVLPDQPVTSILYDTEIPGFGLRITAAGAKSFILNYRVRNSGIERRYTIGAFPAWSAAAARDKAKELRRDVDGGGDPLGALVEQRQAETFADLWQRFQEDHFPTLREATRRDYKAVIETYVLPSLKNRKAVDIEFSEVNRIVRGIAAPNQGNRAKAALSKLFNLARSEWKVIEHNPAEKVKLNPVVPRERYLSNDEVSRFGEALRTHTAPQVPEILALLLLTGARRNEVAGARWDQFDLEYGRWSKPAATTKQKRIHRVPLSADALDILRGLWREAQANARASHDPVSEFVFPSESARGYRVELKGNWRRICKAAGFWGPRTVRARAGKPARTEMGPTVRIHDLRHTFASRLVSQGESLPTIGALLGHTQFGTTHRYAHLFDDPLRRAADSVGVKLIDRAPTAGAKP